MRSIIVSLTMPRGLLAQIDELARREQETRSWVMRRAMRKYVQEAGIGEPGIEVLPLKPQRDLTQVMERHSKIDPNDKELLEFLDDYESNKL